MKKHIDWRERIFYGKIGEQPKSLIFYQNKFDMNNSTGDIYKKKEGYIQGSIICNNGIYYTRGIYLNMELKLIYEPEDIEENSLFFVGKNIGELIEGYIYEKKTQGLYMKDLFMLSSNYFLLSQNRP